MIELMTGKKLLFVGEEIIPFLPETPKSVYGKDVPKYANENGMPVRAMLPKWGHVNERRNQLHEVIRLSGLNIIINDVDHPLLIKVASLPDTKLQVYFTDNNDLFKKRLMSTDADGKEYEDNYVRAIFYARSSLETCNLLRWDPAVIQCQGWFPILVPFYLKESFRSNPIFAESKLIITLYNERLEMPLPEKIKEMICFRNITKKRIDEIGLPLNTFDDLIKFGISFADGVVFGDKDVPSDWVKFAQKRNIPVLDFSEDDFPAKTYNFYKTLTAI